MVKNEKGMMQNGRIRASERRFPALCSFQNQIRAELYNIQKIY